MAQTTQKVKPIAAKMPQNVRPLYDRLLVKRLEGEQTTQSGIIIPDTAQEKTQLGNVVSVGKGRRDSSGILQPLQVVPGDLVMFGKYAGTEVKISGRELLILKEDELLGVVEQ